MKNKNQKIIIIAVLAIALMTLTEIMIRKLVTNIQKQVEQNEETRLQEEIYNSEEKQIERKITNNILNIFEYISQEKYENVYAMLDNDYRMYVFNDSIEEMKSFIKEKIPTSNNIEVVDISLAGTYYKAIVALNDENGYRTRTFTLTNDGEDYKIMFEDFDSINSIDNTIFTDDYIYNVDYKYTTANVLAYAIRVKNISNENKSVQFDDVELLLANGQKVIGEKVDSLVIEPNQEKLIKVLFPKTEYQVYFIMLNDVKLSINK